MKTQIKIPEEMDAHWGAVYEDEGNFFGIQEGNIEIGELDFVGFFCNFEWCGWKPVEGTEVEDMIWTKTHPNESSKITAYTRNEKERTG